MDPELLSIPGYPGGNFWLSEDKFSESYFFFPLATRVYFVIKLAQATKHRVGLALLLFYCPKK